MKRQIYNILQKSLAGFMTVMLALLLGAGISAVPVKAASGSVYTCTINRCYAHPVTGTIEDSGGEASYTTGQGMVEGCVYSGGMLEVADGGQYYLTIRLSLMDYTTNQSFQVQNVGDSGWSSTGTAVTGTGSDSNGATADVCIQVPSENCVVRGSMYVTPMGRDVIFYLYPSDYSAGNSSGMNATMVTESSGGTDTSGGSGTDTANSGTTTTDNSGSTENGTTAGTASGASTTGTGSAASTTTGTTGSTGNTESTGSAGLQSSITEAAAPDSSDASTDSELSDAQGLSLSTRVDGEDADSGRGNGTVSQAMVLTAAITTSGLIILAVAAIVVYYYRRNWKRWGGEDDDDEDDE
ncbi:MAG: heme-binding Shp domain-containing protein [Hespellia sp.]|nr:heme-binding Shp domain-containing protein [Hespellia sp.]